MRKWSFFVPNIHFLSLSAWCPNLPLRCLDIHCWRNEVKDHHLATTIRIIVLETVDAKTLSPPTSYHSSGVWHQKFLVPAIKQITNQFQNMRLQATIYAQTSKWSCFARHLRRIVVIYVRTLHTHLKVHVLIETIRRPSFLRTWRTSSRVRHVLAWGHFDCSTCGDALLHIVSSFPLGRRFSSGLRLKRLSLEMLQHKQGLSVGKVSWLINICNASFSDTYFVIHKAR